MNNKKCILSSVAVVAALISVPAAAQFYVGAGVGAARATGLDGSAVVLGVPVTISGGDATKTSWKLLGGFQFTPNWGIEGQYTDFGNRSATVAFGAPINQSGTFSAGSSQWSFAGTGTLPIDANWYFMGKLGATRNTIDSGTLSAGGITVTSNGESRTDLLVGVGVGFNFNKNAGLRLEYENFGKFSSNGGINGGAIKGDNWGLVFKYAF